MIPKSNSPLQRSSPTESICKSPVDQTICESQAIVTDNKVNHVKEEYVHKLLKDNKNNVCKSCSTDIKEKRKNGVDKLGNQSTNKEKSTKTLNKILVKQSVQSRTNTFVDRKILNDGATCDSRSKADVRNTSKHTKDCLHANAAKLADTNLSTERQVTCKNDRNVQPSPCTLCEFMQKEANVKDGKADGKVACNKGNTGSGRNEVKAKNEINVRVKKDSIKKCENGERSSARTPAAQNSSERTLQVNCHINKHSHEIADKSNSKDGSAINASSSAHHHVDKAGTIANAGRPAYSTVSQTKAKPQSSSLSDVPKFTRSKTCLSDRNLPASRKTRPGTSVIVRGRFQTPENKVFA